MAFLFHPAISALAFFQSTQLSLFERFLTQAVSGIDSTSITSGMQHVAYVVLLIGFLWQVYQSALHGGDVRGLGTNLIKYAVTAIVVMNYHAVFTTINQGFVNAGNWINSASGTTNLLDNWGNDLKTQYNQVGFQNLWGMVTAGVSGFLDALLIIVAYLLYPVVIVIFGFFYMLYGSILYIFGPIVIALMPLGATNRLAKSYVESVFIWNAWPVLYGGFGALLGAVQMGQVGQMLNQNNFLGGLGNLEGSILIGLASIIYSLAIAVIPFIAKKIVSGEVGSTAGTLLGAAVTALTMGIAAGEGVAAGVAGAGTSGAGAGQTATGTASATKSTPISSSGTNQPASPQRSAAIPSGQAQAADGAKVPSHQSLVRGNETPGDQVAASLRGNFGKAVNSDSLKKQEGGALQIGASPGLAQNFSGDTAESLSSRGQSRTTSQSRSNSSRGPTTALMRPHGLATWGAYHAARLATQGAMGGARSAGEVAKGISNPVATASKIGAKTGQVVANVANASEKAAVTAARVAGAVAHPRETVGAGIEAVSDAMTNAMTSTASTIRQSTNAVGNSFTEAYAKTCSGDGSNNDTPA
jgi:hypothetical protein